MLCPNCKNIINDGFSFCPNCGVQINKDNDVDNSEKIKENVVEIECNICGESFNAKENFCPSCGSKITGNEKKKEIEAQLLVNKTQPKKEINPIEKKTFKQTNKTFNDRTKSKVILNTSTEKKINTKKVFYFTGGIVLLGMIIILFSGVLDTPSSEKNISSVQKDSQIDLTAVQKINELEEVVKNDTSNIDNVLHLAHSLNDAGFFIRAIEYYKMYLRKNPKNVEVLIDMGVCYFELKKYSEAKGSMYKGLKINPNHQIGLFNLGIVNFSQGYIDSAKYWWKKAYSINENTEIGKRAKQLLESN